MQIEWFTVIAQILNFFVLAWLLKKFLYKPVLLAIDEREKRITAQLNDAAAAKAAAQKERDDYRQKTEALDREREAQMGKAVADAEAERQRLFESVQKEAAVLHTKLEETWQEDRQNRTNAVKKKIQQEVFAIAGKTLADIAGVGLEEQITHVFIQRIGALNEEENKKLKAAFLSSGDAIVIRSAFPLSEQQKTRIEQALREKIDAAATFRHAEAPDLLTGIEMTTGGYRLSWNTTDYLASMEKNMNGII